MDWNGGTGSNLRLFGTRPPDSSFNFLYTANYDHFSGMEVKNPTETLHGMVEGTDKNMNISYGNMNMNMNMNISMEKKKRLTNEQLESLERSFQEEIKLDPDRKMKLSRELGLQPRQIAVWFQNRRARWKTKQLERLYDGLKQQFDVISREKLRLQEEVLKLKSMLVRDQGEATMKKQAMTSTDVSGEETVESSSEAIRSCSNNMIRSTSAGGGNNNMGECSYMFNVEDYSNPEAVSVPYWGGGGGSVPLLPPSFP